MKYANGELVQLGDRVRLGNDAEGVVVGLIDDGVFGPGFPASEWAYLKTGVLINFPTCGVIHYAEEVECDVSLIGRA